MASSTHPTAARRVRPDRQVIAYLAFTGILLALGIDIALPAFDEIRPAVGLAEGANRITLIITVYFFGMAAGQLFWGPVADRFGRQSAMIAALCLYSAAALVSASTSSFVVMLAARAVWGIGAAAPAGLRAAIARDLYDGDAMARIMSLVMAVFMVGPVLVPLLGKAVLLVAPWRAVFVICAVAAAAHIWWTVRFGETLDPALRRPLEFGATRRAFRRVATTRATVGYTLGYALSSASFFVFLSSTQPIIDEIYDREELFAVIFGAAGAVMSLGFFASDRLIARWGARSVSLAAGVAFVVLAAANLAIVLGASGRPELWVWIVPVIAMNVVAAPLGPASFALGLEPMGDLAGTASGVMGCVSIALAALLAAIFDALIDTTVTPMAVAYLGYGAASVFFLWWAAPAPRNRIDEVTSSPA